MSENRLDEADVPILKGRFFGSLIMLAVFVLWIVFAPQHSAVVIPIYMFIAFLFAFGMDWIESHQLGTYMQNHYPEHCRDYGRWISEYRYGYCSLHDLRFVLSTGRPDEPPGLRRIRRRARQMWVHTLIVTPLCLLFVIVFAQVITKR